VEGISLVKQTPHSGKVFGGDMTPLQKLRCDN
jgi:hypothetical protein